MPHVPALVAGVWSILAAWFLLRAARAEQARTTILALVGLLASAGIAALLIAAQLLPVLEFTSLTLRASTDGPHEIYPFSVEPYRLLEFLWPNLWGTHHGRFRNWVGILPPVHVPRVWIPSLYLGATTLLFALSALQSSRSPSALELIKDPRRWMIWTAAASLLLAVGEFASPLWMARNFVDRQSTLHGNFEPIDPGGGSTPLPDSASSALRLLGRHDPAECPPIRPDGYLRDGDGSPYGLAAHLLPGFKQFRYPAKFLTFTALAITALAAMGLDRALTGRHRTALVIAAVLTVISLALVVAVTSQRSSILQFWANHPELKNNSNTGPFDPDGAYFELQHAFAHSGAFLFVTAILLGLVPRFPRAAAQGIVLLLGLDLAFEARHLVLTAPQSMLEGTPAALAAIQEAESIDAAEGPYRIHRMPYWAPLEWGIEGNPTRYLDYIAWERKTLQPKYLLPNGGEYTLTEGTAELFDFRFFFAPFGGTDDPSVTDQLRLPRGEKVVYFPRRAFDLWNSRYFVLPMVPRNDDKRAIYSLLPDTERITPASDAFTGPDGKEQQDIWLGEEDWQVRKNLHAYPRAWIVHEVIQYPPIQGMRRADRAERMYDILYQDDPLWRMSDRAPYDLKRLAFVESDNAADLAAFLAGSTSAPTDRVRITRYEPQRVELEATLHSPGLVVLADVFYPGWKLTIDGQPAPIHRANRLMRGAAVPKGTHTLVYTYEPSSFRVGLGLSALGLVAFLTVCAWSRLGSSRRMGPI
jgi:hypothetical protein